MRTAGKQTFKMAFYDLVTRENQIWELGQSACGKQARSPRSSHLTRSFTSGSGQWGGGGVTGVWDMHWIPAQRHIFPRPNRQGNDSDWLKKGNFCHGVKWTREKVLQTATKSNRNFLWSWAVHHSSEATHKNKQKKDTVQISGDSVKGRRVKEAEDSNYTCFSAQSPYDVEISFLWIVCVCVSPRLGKLL